jgi:hypothetical protein
MIVIIVMIVELITLVSRKELALIELFAAERLFGLDIAQPVHQGAEFGVERRGFCSCPGTRLSD